MTHHDIYGQPDDVPAAAQAAHDTIIAARTTTTEPAAAKTPAEWAREIVADIDIDIRLGEWAKPIPPDVADFGELHDYCDANGYLERLGHFDGSDAAVQQMVDIEDEVSRLLAARAPAVRQRMAQVVTHDLGWYVADDEEDAEHERNDVRAIAEAFTDEDCAALYLEDGPHSAEQIAGYMREWFDTAEKWLLADWPRGWHVIEHRGSLLAQYPGGGGRTFILAPSRDALLVARQSMADAVEFVDGWADYHAANTTKEN